MNLAKVLFCIEGAMIDLGYVTNQEDCIKDACKLLQDAHDEITEKISKYKVKLLKDKPMITKDEIGEAAKQNTYDDLMFAKRYDPEVMLKTAFEDGVNWYKEELWHHFLEEPEMDEKVLCRDINNEFVLVEADADWKQKVGIYEIQKWCYLKDLA